VTACYSLGDNPSPPLHFATVVSYGRKMVMLLTLVANVIIIFTHVMYALVVESCNGHLVQPPCSVEAYTLAYHGSAVTYNHKIFMATVWKDFLSQLGQVYIWWLFTDIQNITTIYKLIYKTDKSHNINIFIKNAMLWQLGYIAEFMSLRPCVR
jgi:hypothetical protein